MSGQKTKNRLQKISLIARYQLQLHFKIVTFFILFVIVGQILQTRTSKDNNIFLTDCLKTLKRLFFLVSKLLVSVNLFTDTYCDTLPLTNDIIFPFRTINTLSPTEKNEIFNLAHLALRLLLFIVQKLNSSSEVNRIVKDIRVCLRELMFDDDVPMDTKSVCGILYLNMQLLEHGAGSWIDVSASCKSNLHKFYFLG